MRVACVSIKYSLFLLSDLLQKMFYRQKNVNRSCIFDPSMSFISYQVRERAKKLTRRFQR